MLKADINGRVVGLVNLEEQVREGTRAGVRPLHRQLKRSGGRGLYTLHPDQRTLKWQFHP